jgi:hypothetical protein
MITFLAMKHWQDAGEKHSFESTRRQKANRGSYVMKEGTAAIPESRTWFEISKFQTMA